MSAIEQALVPCNGCTACCRGPVVLHPSLGDDPLRYEGETTPLGRILKRKENGDCYYLREGGCSIWPDVPAVCRAFDCRVYASTAWAVIDPLRDEAVIEAGKARSL